MTSCFLFFFFFFWAGSVLLLAMKSTCYNRPEILIRFRSSCCALEGFRAVLVITLCDGYTDQHVLARNRVSLDMDTTSHHLLLPEYNLKIALVLSKI